MRGWLSGLLLLALPACTDGRRPDLLVVGDSMLAWHRTTGRSVPDVVGRDLDLQVDHRAVSGSQLTRGPMAIPGRYREGPYRWLLVDGGANDLNARCRCEGCDAILDALASPDGAGGALPALVDQALADGLSVVVMGYPTLPDDARYGFDRCHDELPRLHARYRAAADRRPGVTFVDMAAAIDGEDPALFDTDRVHPSVVGAAIMGERVADAIRSAEDGP